MKYLQKKKKTTLQEKIHFDIHFNNTDVSKKNGKNHS